jgi:ribose-phosphate pyrophosphokinase
LAIIDKRREKAGDSEVMNIIGDVEGVDCIMLDDIVDSAGTLCNAAGALKKAGAKTVTAYVSHGVLSGEAVKRVNDSPMEKLIVTDSIEATPEMLQSSKIQQISIAPLMAEAIIRISQERSVSSLFG